GIGMGLVRTVRPWHEWLLTWGYDIDQPPPEMTDEIATGIVRDLVGDQDIPVEITSTSLWTVNHSYATEYSVGRVFCAGDAVHRHPPSNGLGSNTSIQDSYNLAWKLAMVIRGEAGPALLDTYSAERAPVGKQIVDRANLSRDQFGPIFAALGMTEGGDQDAITAGLAAARAPGPDGVARRRALEAAIELKNYEFNAHGVELNQRYVSTAVLAEDEPETFARDAELFHQPTTRPGAKLPHVWLVDAVGQRISSLDLVGTGAFTVLTGSAGTAWVDACRSTGFGVPLRVVVVGAENARDAYGDWRRATAAAVEEDGCLLVRPDGYVAWRSAGPPADDEDAAKQLRGVLEAVLSRTVGA
ncbi:MAG TPA: FAD-dependent monooxygenase, partial [Pseudonocardiaceae bacterium]|nr:FAD-dependent monooxygenase [Pseudonocardiaceae bacterium]